MSWRKFIFRAHSTISHLRHILKECLTDFYVADCQCTVPLQCSGTHVLKKRRHQQSQSVRQRLPGSGICKLFFLKFLGATGTPVMDVWWRLLWVSKPEWVLSYSLFCGGECNVHSPRSTSGATHAHLLAASMQPVFSRHACTEVGLGSDSKGEINRDL